MNFHHARTSGLLLSALLVATTSASAAPLNVRLGLWESTTTTESSGMPPIDTSSVPPEQRARIEAMLKKRQAQGPRTLVFKTCLTKEKLERDPFANSAQRGESCSTHMISQSSTHWQGKTVCTGNGRQREVTINYSALSRERVKGTIRVRLSGAGREMEIHGTIAGKWLGPDCGKLR